MNVTPSPVGTYLRFIRRRSGLSQKQLAQILGTVSQGQISRHERSVSQPSLLVAFGYEAVFRQPVSEIFPGFYHTVETAINERMEELESRLSDSTARGRAAALIARQLEWLCERRNPESI